MGSIHVGAHLPVPYNHGGMFELVTLRCEWAEYDIIKSEVTQRSPLQSALQPQSPRGLRKDDRRNRADGNIQAK